MSRNFTLIAGLIAVFMLFFSFAGSILLTREMRKYRVLSCN